MKKGLSLVLVQLILVALASTSFAAAGADSGALLKDFLYRVLNFVVAFGLVGYFVSKPFRAAMAGRSEKLAQALKESQAVREDAEAKFAEYDAKLSKAAAEIDEIYAGIRREGEIERDKILANARQMAEKIKADAQKAAANEISAARAELRREAAALAVTLAEDILKKNVTEQDQVRLIDEYMKKVGELH